MVSVAYKTNINYNRKRAYKSRFSKRLKDMKKQRSKKSWSRAALKSDVTKAKIKKVLGVFAGIAFIFIFIGTVFTLSVVAKYSSELPNPDEPFERGQDLTSFMYDRNGKELYKIHGDENRDIAKIEDIPLTVQWAFIAVEDLDFYTHKGVDMGGLVKAGLFETFGIGTPRGGSTITQQMIKNTVLTSERSYERKIKEIILSLRIEQKYDKQEVLQLYLNEIGFGGNTYGLKTAARVYFGKDVKDLTLGEGALLAGLPQAPGLYSPLFAADVTTAREKAIERQNVVLNAMIDHKDKINAYARKFNGLGDDEELITEEMIEKAREEKMNYKSGDVNINAPHFVFYTEDELQKGNYNNGRPFTLSEIERGGLKITTSIDLDMQKIAEESVKQGVENIAKGYGGNNAALVTIDPLTGQILTMVGSADYFGEATPEGCTLGLNCKFEPKVNASVSLRQPGSSLKPMVYYTGFETGQLYPASFLPDIEIQFSGGYKPKNNEGGFMGPMNLRKALYLSRNIPAVEGLEIVGVTQFLNTLEKFGYTTFTKPEEYGAALALGAGDVKLVEHTNGFAVLATQGTHHPLSPILKIEDKDGNVIYEYDKDESRVGTVVADENAAYMINDIIKNYHVTPPAGYEFAGKTGTSDDNKNVYYMGYSPNFVTGVWVGNNDNSKMSTAAYGYSVARPIWIDYTNKVIGRFAPAKFPRPGKVVSASVCADSGLLAEGGCEAISDLFIKDKLPPKDESHQVYRVCSDQPDKLARPIDEQLGYAVDKVYAYIKAPKPEWQVWFDKALGQGSPPTESCTIDRNPNQNQNPWVIISKPGDGTLVQSGGTLDVEATAYSMSSDISKVEVYIDSTFLAQASNNPYAGTVTLPSLSDGVHSLVVKAYDAAGKTGSSSVSIIVGDVVTITQPASGSSHTVGIPVSIEALHQGAGNVVWAKVYVNGSEIDEMVSTGGGSYVYSWTPPSAGNYTIRVTLRIEGSGNISSQPIQVAVKT